MGILTVFENISLDGYFSGVSGDFTWAQSSSHDPEWDQFVAGNASGGGILLFGRITYQIMESYWPSPMAAKRDPVVAEQINTRPKIVFSKTLDNVSWSNTQLMKTDLEAEICKLKAEPDLCITVLGSGSIALQLTQAGLVDEYHFVVNPVILGSGRTLFGSIEQTMRLSLNTSRMFENGNVYLTYSTSSLKESGS